MKPYLIFMMALAGAIAIIAPFDPRLVTGINPWIKPFKFTMSFALFGASMIWMLAQLEIDERSKRRFSLGFCAIVVVELLAIISQAARGTTSHFNNSSLYDGIVFSFMGIFVIYNWVLVARMAYLFFKRPSRLSGPLLWGVRAGLLANLFALVDGVAMVVNNAHTVGMADGGPGLPFLTWSTRAGDLRVSHFLALHAVQALPLLGWALQRVERPKALFALGASLYCALMVGLFVMALFGRPIFLL